MDMHSYAHKIALPERRYNTVQANLLNLWAELLTLGAEGRGRQQDLRLCLIPLDRIAFPSSVVLSPDTILIAV